MKDNVIDLILAVVSALGGAGGIAALIKRLIDKKLNDAASVRAAAKQISEDGHEETQRLVKESLSVLLAENAQLRADNEEKDAAIAKLRKDLSNALRLKEQAGKKS